MIRLPWVSREALDLATLRAIAEHENAQALRSDLLRAEARYADLLGRYHLLRLQGFTTPIEAPPVVRAAVDPVLSAIARKAGRNTELRRTMEQQATVDRANKVPDVHILAQIERGRVPDDEEITV